VSLPAVSRCIRPKLREAGLSAAGHHPAVITMAEPPDQKRGSLVLVRVVGFGNPNALRGPCRRVALQSNRLKALNTWPRGWRYASFSPKQHVTPPPSREAARAGFANSWRSTGPAVEQLPTPKVPLGLLLSSSRGRPSFRPRFQPRPFLGAPWRKKQYRVQQPLRRRPLP
jgi:hypothetical protein